MIRAIYKLVVAESAVQFDELKEFFIGFELALGEAWEGNRSRGAKFRASEAGVEIGIGQGFPAADLVLEVDSADEVYEFANKRGVQISEDIADYEWGARMFTMMAPGGLSVAVFSYVQTPEQRRALTGHLNAKGLRFGIVVPRFNAFITDRLLAGAFEALRLSGAEDSDIHVVRVSGSFEVPAAARSLANTRDYDAIICLGCLLRGDTLHYEVIANEVTRGVGQSAQETGIPHGFGVLTCDTLEQALDRSGLKAGNKGFEAAMAAIEMANLNKAVGAEARASSQSGQA